MKRSGFSLIEVLVVIVILAVGVLTVIRIYPRGFIGLTVSRDFATAQSLGRAELEKLEAKAEDLPEAILAVRYIYRLIGGNWVLVLESDPDVRPDELGPGGQILESGDILINNPGGAPTLIFWRYYNDANRFRRVVGEGGRIPAPTQVGNYFGSLRMLQFGPIVNLPNLLLVYSSDLQGREQFGRSASEPLRNPRQWEFFHDDENALLWLHGVAGRLVRYKVNFSYWENHPTYGYRKVDLVDVVLTVLENPNVGDPREAQFDVVNNEVYPFDLRAVAGDPPNWVGLVDNSIEVNRLYERIPDASPFSATYPYEYKVLNPTIGALLFNPAGYNYRERRQQGTVPLTAQVNYDVYNWHILREDFRADRTRAPLQKLPLQRVKAFNDLLNDKRRYPGLDFPVPDGLGGSTTTQDVVIVDLATGGIVMPLSDPSDPNSPRCYKVDYLRGVIALASPLTRDPELSSNGLTILPPGTGQALVFGVNPAGRDFRVFYQAHNDWAVQVFKSSSVYRIQYGLPLSVGQCYPWNPWDNLGIPTRVYFPQADIGFKVAIREVWYRRYSGDVLRVMRDQDFQVRAEPGDPLAPLGYIDIRELDQAIDIANGGGLDYVGYGYAVRGVSGTSARARVIWNMAEKEDVPGNSPQDIARRIELHEAWTNKWRFVRVETYMTRRDTTN